jgi:outer membrane protein assembly factor BamB
VAESYGPDGSLLWQYALDPSEIGYSSHVIDNANVIYFATSTASGLNQRVVALREADGTALWAITLPTVAPVYNGVLASTPSGTLVASVSERLFGIYAGNGLSSAPWPRFRGANANDSTPATVAQPSP